MVRSLEANVEPSIPQAFTSTSREFAPADVLIRLGEDSDQPQPDQPDEDAFSAGGTSPPEWSEPVGHRDGWNLIPPHFDRAHLAMGFVTTATSPATPSDPYPNVPQDLKDLPNWVVWKYADRIDDPTKVAYDSRIMNAEQRELMSSRASAGGRP